MKTKPNRGKGYTAGNSCITEVVIDNEPAKLLLDPEAFFPCLENKPSSLLYDHKEAFASDKEPLGAIIGHEVEINLNFERPYPPLLIRPAYPASPKSREALEIHITDLLDLVLIRKLGHNEVVEITTPVIVAWHNGKSKMVGDFRALNTYTVPDRYPIPKIQIAITQISQVVYASTMDALKGFHQNVVTPRARKYFKIIAQCGVYEYLRMPFGIKNAPSHLQRMMNKFFPEELSKGWLIIYIDDIIVCSKTWEEHICRVSKSLTKI
ncbi:hypothetical protein O181_099584 [Austropuccinia psidii MF-1]|uniref:Reverse transcriptase domain-containing protein n=1 Tax=Austropuccinia psidii MF-1 TaxID=1389203 RepID=A0A9Q3JDJ9_9BASI|nr:hypothetical protein [Austropuccinia psidii MF-1]